MKGSSARWNPHILLWNSVLTSRHMKFPRTFTLLSAIASAVLASSTAHAGCNCNGGASAAPGYVDQGILPPDYEMAPMGMTPYAGPMGMGMATAGMAVGAYTPPPGTLGRTYQLRSRGVPTDKHPRAGMLDLKVAGATKIIVHSTDEFRTEDKMEGFRNAHDETLYHFTSEPLYPGLPHIYRVEVHLVRDGNPVVEERYIRLIMGRIVHLNI